MKLMKLFDLCGSEDDRKTSPYCWRIRLALAHKQIGFSSVPWRAEEKDAIAFSGQVQACGQLGTPDASCSFATTVLERISLQVPVLIDGETTVVDSWRIAEYLESSYPNAPSFFGSKEGK